MKQEEIKERLKQISDVDLDKIHQLQRLRYILDSGGVASAPTTITILIDDSEGMSLSKHIIRQFAAYMDYVRFKRCRLLDLVDVNRMENRSIYDGMTDVLVVDSSYAEPTKYIENHFGSLEDYYANIGLVMDSISIHCATRLDFKTEPTSVIIEDLPRHIVILSPVVDLPYLVTSEVPELSCGVDVIDLRGLGCADILDSTVLFETIFKPDVHYPKEAIPVLLLNWKPPTYWEFMKSRNTQ